MNDKDKQLFWDKKIVTWEESKYSQTNKFYSVFLDVNASVKNRLKITRNILKQVVKDRIVLEIGCGSSAFLLPPHWYSCL